MALFRSVLKHYHRTKDPRGAQNFLRLWARLSQSAEARRELMSVSYALGDIEEAISACESLLARDPDDRQALLDLGLLRLGQNDPAGALPFLERLESLEAGAPCTLRACRDSRMDPERAAQGIPYVATFEDALVETAQWSVVVGPRVFFRETHGREIGNGPFVKGRVTQDGTTYLLSLREPEVTIEAPCVLLGGDDDYLHWLLRSVIKLALLEDDPEAKAMPLLTSEVLPRHALEWLQLLGFDEGRLIRLPHASVARCKELVVPTVLRAHPRMRLGIEWLRGRVAGLLAAPPQANELLYVSSRDRVGGALLNDAELAQALEARGFRTLVPSEVSVADQVRAFSRARVIVGAQGPALANVMFAPPGARFIEITSTNLREMADTRLTAQAANLQTAVVTSDDYGPDSPEIKHPMYLPYRVRVEEVLHALEPALASQ